jgi:hypothetical protein
VVLSVWTAGAGIVRYGWTPAERCPTVSPEAATTAALDAAAWLARAQQADGRFVYEYDRATGAPRPGYNVVRHTGVLLSLYQLAGHGRPEGLPTAERALAFALDHLIERDGWAAVALPGADAELGATALLLVSLIERAQVTGDHTHDDLAVRLGRFVLHLQQDDGNFSGVWSRRLEAPLPDSVSRYATAEALFALSVLGNRFPDGGWREPARRTSHYIVTRRDEDEGYDFLPWGDQWTAYAFDRMAAWPLNDEEAAYARRLAQRFGYRTRREAQKRTTGVMSLLREPPSRGAGFGTTLEGLGSMWRLSGTDGRLAGLRSPLAQRVACAAALLVERQATAADAPAVADPGLVDGAWFFDDVTRMDDQQHALAGLAAAAVVMGTG